MAKSSCKIGFENGRCPHPLPPPPPFPLLRATKFTSYDWSSWNLSPQCKKTNRHQAKPLVTSQHPENTKKIPQASRNSKNNIPYKELGMRMVSDLSTATTLEHRRQIVKEKDSQLRILYTAKLSIKCEGKIMTFSHIKCLKILTSRVPFSQESLRMTNQLQ